MNWRTRAFPRDFAAGLLLAGLAAYVLGANPFTRETVAPLDLLTAPPGWSTVPATRQPANWEPSDIIDSQLPVWISLKAQIYNGRGFFWYPFGSGGQPVITELTSPAFLLFLLIKDNALAYYCVGLAKLFVSGIGCYLLLVGFLPWWPAVWGGLAFMVCGFNAAWFYWDHAATAMWIPWLLWATARYLQTGRSPWLPVVTFTSLLLLFGAYLPVAAYGFFAFALLALLWAFADLLHPPPNPSIRRTRRVSSLVAKMASLLLAVGLAFLMSAIMLLPLKGGLSKVDLSYRREVKIYGTRTIFGAGTDFRGVRDLALFAFDEHPAHIERAAYVGIPVLLLALLGVAFLSRARSGAARRMILFALLLVITSTLLAFGILPHRFIASFPLLSFNKWNRLIVLTHLGLALLSAFGVDRLLAFLARSPRDAVRGVSGTLRNFLVVLGLGVFVLNLRDLRRHFHIYNTVVPAAWFFPLTPNLAYVRDHLAPLQSVIADDPYGMSGSLGAYGISQWYAHSFKTEEEKELLGRLVQDPFPSPTISLIYSTNINFDSWLMDALAVKYVLVHGSFLERQVTTSSPPESSAFPIPPLPANSWTQHLSFECPADLGAIGLMFTLPDGKSPAELRLELRRGVSGPVLASASLDRKKVAGGEWVYFEFPERAPLEKGDYSFSVSLADYTGPGQLSARGTRYDAATGYYLEINGARREGSLALRIGYYEPLDVSMLGQKWSLLKFEKETVILENRLVTGDAYFVRDLGEGSDLDFSGVAVAQPSAEQLEVRYVGADAGWVVLAMQAPRGWVAAVDGKPVRYDTFLGVLPAIPVPGPCRVTFWYSPPAVRQGAALSAFGALLFLALLGTCLRRAREE